MLHFREFLFVFLSGVIAIGSRSRRSLMFGSSLLLSDTIPSRLAHRFGGCMGVQPHFFHLDDRRRTPNSFFVMFWVRAGVSNKCLRVFTNTSESCGGAGPICGKTRANTYEIPANYMKYVFSSKTQPTLRRTQLEPRTNPIRTQLKTRQQRDERNWNPERTQLEPNSDFAKFAKTLAENAKRLPNP